MPIPPSAVHHVVKHGAVAAHHGLRLSGQLLSLLATAAVTTYIASLNADDLQSWFAEQLLKVQVEGGVAIQVAVAGTMRGPKFTQADGEPINAVLQTIQNQATGEVLRHRVVRFKEIQPALAATLADGQPVVFE